MPKRLFQIGVFSALLFCGTTTAAKPLSGKFKTEFESALSLCKGLSVKIANTELYFGENGWRPQTMVDGEVSRDEPNLKYLGDYYKNRNELSYGIISDIETVSEFTPFCDFYLSTEPKAKRVDSLKFLKKKFGNPVMTWKEEGAPFDLWMLDKFVINLGPMTEDQKQNFIVVLVTEQ